MSISLISVSILFLVLFSVLSAFDSLYYHFYRFQLYRREQCFREHFFHTTNLIFFILSTFFLFTSAAYGLRLWLGLIFSVVFLISELCDLSTEKLSRQQWGGVPTGEYVCHFLVGISRGAYFILILMAQPSEKWSLSATQAVPKTPTESWIVLGVQGSALILAFVHLVTLVFFKKSFKAVC